MMDSIKQSILDFWIISLMLVTGTVNYFGDRRCDEFN